ncbi:MAG: EFR1 family ferrodoxin [Halobacteriota archaeon]|nr:EFR1 family ferrodoxin [Halobacteriota archaeon]
MIGHGDEEQNEKIIYFFTGTGNSLWLAQIIKKNILSKMVPIPSTLNNESIYIQEEVIGIVTPVYYGDLPNIVKGFLNKLKNIENKYIFLVVNYGGGAGVSVSTAKKLIKKNGGNISAVYSIHMPQNAFFKHFENYQRLYSEAEELLKPINAITEKRKNGRFTTSRVMDIMQEIIFRLLKSQYKKHLIKLSALEKNAKVEEAIYKADRTFSINKKCNGCGTCQEICPVNNIKIINEKPQWQNRCENCLACYNWCPQKAIYGPLVEHNYYYHHPMIKMKDLLYQKKGFID